MYDMDIEPGHRDCISQVIHVPLEEYRVGSPHYEQLMVQLAEAQRFQQPDHLMFNL